MSRRRCALALAAAMVGTVLSSPTASASIVRALELSELAARADRIVVADVLSVASAWDAAHRNIHTTVALAIQESWKGEAPNPGRLTLRQLGGTVGEIEMSVLGAARFVPGERALFFLKGRGLVGMAQGKRTLRWKTADRRWWVEPADQAGASLVDGRGRPRPQLPPAEALESLRRRVQQLLGE
jgi:hypothetical protein